jgi:hypothetical protein
MANQSQPRPRHRAKPKFDIPVETVPAELAKPSNGWVYRAEAERAAPPLPRMTESGPFEMIAEGMFLVGFGSLRLTYWVVSAPFRL